MSSQDARGKIEKLVAYFDDNIYQLKSSAFNETQTRQQLIDPFFEALGWDVRNRAMKPLFMQEVVPEGRVKTKIGRETREQPELFKSDSATKEYASILDYIAEDEYKSSSKEATKKPDYRFRIQGQTKFFVEAKKPSVDLANQDAIFQVKRYGFSGRVPVSVLTDFDQFRVFDCTQKPEYTKPKVGIIREFDISYQHYLDKFEQIFDTFSRDAVASGSLDSLVKKQMQKRTGDFELDKTFLDDLSEWRAELARDIARHPKNRRKLNDYTLNESVQRILDRIVFFRVCEDREIEVENTLLAILQLWQSRPGISLYSLLNQLFKERRALYNGLLFSPHECEDLEVSNEVLIKILQNLNYPFSPYHFNEIGVEILGNIYEKFLGKTIHLISKTAKVQDKPEVRKAGGVYYTPQYIVNYIVDNTLGKLLYKENGRDSHGSVIARSEATKQSHLVETAQKVPALTPKEVAKLKIIDIACGSGSFLLGAFQKLIDYHLEWYTSYPKDIQTIQRVPDAYKDANGNLHLSARKKRDILLNNIYGVDIDRQAVEVTQMSLYLKVLEGENAETLNPQMTLALKEVYLPSLKENIKCGNSLIGTDFMAQGELFDEELRHKVNPFDWEAEFPEIMSPSSNSGGGFDCLIGNPPYGKAGDEDTKVYLNEKYQLFGSVPDWYLLFIEKAHALLKKNGRMGYIIPSAWAGGPSYVKAREFLLTKQIDAMMHLPFDVFADAYIDTTILITGNNQPTAKHLVATYVYPKKEKLNSIAVRKDDYQYLSQDEWEAVEDKKFVSDPIKLHVISSARKSTQLSFDDVTTIKRGVLFDKDLLTSRKTSQLSFRYFEGDVYRYQINLVAKRWIEFNDKLRERPKERCWFEGERLLLRRLVNRKQRIMCGFTAEPFISNKNLYSVLPKNPFPCLKAILGVLNSRLISYLYINQVTQAVKDDFPQVTIQDVLKLPFPNFDNQHHDHDKLVNLVEHMIAWHNELQAKQFDSEREPIERQIAATDKKIDELVYQLYGLTEEEIKVVEGKK